MIDWSKIAPPGSDEDAAAARRRSEEALRALLAARLRAVHRPTGVHPTKLAEAMAGLELRDAEAFGEAVAEEDRGLGHFVGPLLDVAADQIAPKPYRALAAASLALLEAAEAAPVLGKLVLDPDLSSISARGLLMLRTDEAYRLLVQSLTKAEGWAKADVIGALLQVNDPELDELLLVEASRGVGPALPHIAYPVAARVGLDRALAGELGEPARAAGVDLFIELLEQEASGEASASRPPLLVGELVEAMLDGLGESHASFREVRAATLVLAMEESPSLEEDLQRMIGSVDIASEVAKAVESGRIAPALALTRTFRNLPAAAILFDELVANEKAEPQARGLALRIGAELGEPRAAGVVKAALEHPNETIRAAALDAARYLVQALGAPRLVEAVKRAFETRKPLLCRAALGLALDVPDPSLAAPIDSIRDVFDPADQASLKAVEAALALARSAGSTAN
ncbi:MAG: hypothetical protein HYY06_15535 [Deltaproteobacteria bacterium]|nr:hypothetical protein [Deltaproteobacteria bacterium]